MGEYSDQLQISLHESGGISYINTGKANNYTTEHHLHYLHPRLKNHIYFTTVISLC